MPSVQYNGIEIAYLDEGEGDPVILLHRLGSNKVLDWVAGGWFGALKRAGFRVIAPDLRGHGASSKPHAPLDYASVRMVEDLHALVSHIDAERVDLVGYSLGARTAAAFAIAHPKLARNVVLAGIGMDLVESSNVPFRIAAALKPGKSGTVHDPVAIGMREFAERNAADLKAVAACLRGERPIAIKELTKIRSPVLVVVGDNDEVAAGDPRDRAPPGRALARLIPTAKTVSIPGADHLKAFSDPEFREQVVAFLVRRR